MTIDIGLTVDIHFTIYHDSTMNTYFEQHVTRIIVIPCHSVGMVGC